VPHVRLEDVELTEHGDRIVANARPVGPGREFHLVLTIRDGRILDMQDCPTRAAAERYARG
jgi:hypothetical protein